MQEPPKTPNPDLVLFRRTLVVAAGVGFAVIVWKLADLILLLLASVLVAFIFYKFAHFLKRHTRLPFAAALVLAILLPVLFLALTFTMFGSLMANQFAILFDQLPVTFVKVRDWLQGTSLGREVIAHAGSLMPEGGRIVAMVQSFVSSLGVVGTSLGVVLVGGVYLAAQPRLYGDGILKLLPPYLRPKIVSTMRAIADAITAWLKAQGLSMLFIGVFTGAALSAIGLPAAPAIGLVAGLCEFVPYLGTIVVAIPSILIGFSISTETGIWTAIAIVVIQQVQGNIVTPIVQSSVAELPPALTVFSLIAAGIILGPMGVILAVPLTVVAQTLVRQLVHYPDDGPGDEPADQPAAAELDEGAPEGR